MLKLHFLRDITKRPVQLFHNSSGFPSKSRTLRMKIHSTKALYRIGIASQLQCCDPHHFLILYIEIGVEVTNQQPRVNHLTTNILNVRPKLSQMLPRRPIDPNQKPLLTIIFGINTCMDKLVIRLNIWTKNSSSSQSIQIPPEKPSASTQWIWMNPNLLRP